ncbi:MAG: tRNA 2-selenouridine synthase [Rhizobacter sp.]|nr:tRNA 2-selenouridine synthase [Rhizobacter sp.]
MSAVAPMSSHRPITIADIASFDQVVDARSPAEFALDHIPGAINCPVLDDAQRVVVGTLYKQQGAFEARRVGGAMVAGNIASHLQRHFADKPKSWRPLVYCWRGGLRSGSFVTWLRLVGWDAQQLAGGYKTFRRHVIDQVDALSPQLRLRVLSGPTGSAKTRVLQALAARGEQVLDLEAMARHKGSVLGDLPGVPQPSQKHFETQLAQALGGFDLSREVFVEAESRKIGRIMLPTPLLERLRASPCVEIEASAPTRLAYLLRDYAYLGDDRERLAASLGQLKELQSKETIARWQAWARAGELAPLFEELMALHYDVHYKRSQAAHLSRWEAAAHVQADDLSPCGIEAVADRIATRLG